MRRREERQFFSKKCNRPTTQNAQTQEKHCTNINKCIIRSRRYSKIVVSYVNSSRFPVVVLSGIRTGVDTCTRPAIINCGRHQTTHRLRVEKFPNTLNSAREIVRKNILGNRSFICLPGRRIRRCRTNAGQRITRLNPNEISVLAKRPPKRVKCCDLYIAPRIQYTVRLSSLSVFGISKV